MTMPAISSRPFVPGTTGWSVTDLDDPQIGGEWFAGRYEIIEGVLTTMPAAYFAGGNAVFYLMFMIEEHLRRRGIPGRIAPEVDIVLNESRVIVSDAALLLPHDIRAQQNASHTSTPDAATRLRLVVPPTLIVESVSPGHEMHDRRNKKRWYAEFGVPNYWILDAFGKSLECLRLNGATYSVDAQGRGDEVMQPALFPGLVIDLKQVWRD